MIDWNDLYEKFKNKQLGKDQLEIIKKGVVDDYNSNPDLQRLVQGVGNFYQDLRTVEGEEKYNPLNYLTAGTLRAMEGAGWLADQTAGRFLKDTIHNTLRVDPSVAEIGSQGVQMFAAPKAISKGISLLNKGIASPQAHNLAYKAGQSARRLKDRLGSVPTTAYDDAIGIFELSSKEFNELSKLSKQPGINSLTLARRFQLQKKALERKYGKAPDSDIQMMAIGGMGDLGMGSFGTTKKESVLDYRNRHFNQAQFEKDANGNYIYDDRKVIKNLKGEPRRLTTQLAQTKPGQTVKRSFENTREKTKYPFIDELGGYMKLTGSKPNLHHRFAPQVTAPLYRYLALDDTPGSEWMQLTEFLNSKGIYPGSPVSDPSSLGGPESNLTQLVTKGVNQRVVLPDGTEKLIHRPPEPHDILHHQYYKNLGLQDVEEGKASWFDKRMYKITGSHEGRMQVAEELAEIVNEGDRIIDAAMGQIRALFGNKTDPQVITNLLAEMAQTGKLKITGTKYRLKSVEAIVRIIQDEVKANMPLSDEFEVMKIVESYNLSADAELDAIDLLHNIADYNESMRVFGKRPPSITHKKHKENVQKYMELIQPTLFDIDIPAKTEAIKTFTYKRVKPQPIDKQLELLFSDD